MSAVYHEFTLDGFHYRTLDRWPRETSRVEIPARFVPPRRIGNRIQAGYNSPATAVVERTSWRTEAKKHAIEHGEAGVWRADDSLIIFTRNSAGGVSQRTIRHARPR